MPGLVLVRAKATRQRRQHYKVKHLVDLFCNACRYYCKIQGSKELLDNNSDQDGSYFHSPRHIS